MSNRSRRHLIKGALAGAASISLFARSSFALNDQEASELISRAVQEITSAINSQASDAAVIAEFEAIFKRYADVTTIARTTLGPDARRASSAQLRAYSDAFSGYLARKYGRQFRQFEGGRVTVEGTRPVRSFFEVRAVARLRDRSSFPLTFLVSDRSGKDLFFDMQFEGVSLLRSERTEIGSMLDRHRGDIDLLIQDLRSAG